MVIFLIVFPTSKQILIVKFYLYRPEPIFYDDIT